MVPREEGREDHQRPRFRPDPESLRPSPLKPRPRFRPPREKPVSRGARVGDLNAVPASRAPVRSHLFGQRLFAV
eukprot:166765-Rhodomonas_salina.1